MKENLVRAIINSAFRRKRWNKINVSFRLMFLLQEGADMVHPVSSCVMSFTTGCTSAIAGMAIFFIKMDIAVLVSVLPIC